MSLLNKTIGFVAVFGMLPAAHALTARPSMVGNASSRMTTMITRNNNTTLQSPTPSVTLANTECIDAYTSCMKGADTCGPNFEECTTKVLFHGKMAQCLSTLMQCSDNGVESLFGVKKIESLQTWALKNDYDEVTDYTYPTDGSIMGQMIIGAAISNKYDTSTCIKRYTSCLKKDSVCGGDFELCTSGPEFKKQRIFCDSTLARCQSDGLIELFGQTSVPNEPAGRIGEMIAEGAALAAVNSVSTCYKVVDQCILNSCANNPYRCIEGMSTATANAADSAGDTENAVVGATIDTTVADKTSKSDVSSFIKNACLNTIGSNKYCYATFIGNGQMPTASQLRDEDNQEEVYDSAYASRMNSAMKAKITSLMEKFDTKAKQKCTETIRACAMRTCGSGVGAACYYQVFNGNEKSINKSDTRDEIKIGCSAIVNTDAYCKYAAASLDNNSAYAYTYMNQDAFDTLFPEYDGDNTTNSDPIGVVASLNASLANNYSDAALAQMKKQCQSVATSCVRSMCGADYENCYRNRTDIYSDLTKTTGEGSKYYNKSMNKVGGVLDYTVVLGLCLDTVKNASVCEEHLAIEQKKVKLDSDRTSSWGGSSSVRGGWIDAGAATEVAGEGEIYATDENDNRLCTTKNGTERGVCDTVDANGVVYDQPVIIGYETYVQSQAANSLFKDLIYDLEKEVQAKYNAKLTKEQNACRAANQGGLMGKLDHGATYMWAKLKSNKVPKNYSVSGLKDSQFVESNDLYGSFCRVRVTLQSDDKDIQDELRKGANWSTAYFAVGDVFTCGSWIPSSALEEIATEVSEKSVENKEAQNKRLRGWMTALGVVGGTVGGGYLGYGLQNGKVFGKLTGLKDDNKDTVSTSRNSCVSNVQSATTAVYGYIATAADARESKKPTVSSSVYSVTSVCKRFAERLGEDSNGAVNTAISNLLSSYSDIVDNNKNADFDSNFVNLLNALETAATVAKGANEVDKKNNNRNIKWVGSTVGAAVGAAAGGLITHYAIKDAQDSKLEEEQQKAYDEFMEQVGRHIFCYIGGEEAGSYGETVQSYVE